MTTQQKNNALRWRKEGYTIAKIAERLGVSQAAVKAALPPTRSKRQEELLKETAARLRRAGYSEAVIVANFGRDV